MTTKTAVVRARIEPSIKKRVEKVLRRIGLSQSDAINVFFKRIADEQAIPFSLNMPNKTTRKAIKDARALRGTRMFETFDAFADHVRSL